MVIKIYRVQISELDSREPLMRPQLDNETSWEYQRGARFENNKNDSIFFTFGSKECGLNTKVVVWAQWSLNEVPLY